MREKILQSTRYLYESVVSTKTECMSLSTHTFYFIVHPFRRFVAVRYMETHSENYKYLRRKNLLKVPSVRFTHFFFRFQNIAA